MAFRYSPGSPGRPRRHPGAPREAATAPLTAPPQAMAPRLGFSGSPFYRDSQRLRESVALGVPRPDGCRRSRRHASQLAQRSDTVERRHRQIEQDHIGVKSLRQLDHLEAVGTLADDLELVPFEHAPDALTHKRRIVAHHYRDAHDRLLTL